MGPPYCPCLVAVWKQCKRHGKRREERATRSQIKLSRSREQKHTALEGKPLEEGSMPSSVVMSLDAGQMSGLLLVSANRQTDGTIVTRGHVFWRGCPMGKNWTQHGLASVKACRSSPVCLFITRWVLQVKDTLKPLGRENTIGESEIFLRYVCQSE